MEETINKQYDKRTQRDYTMSFKLAIVQEVESGSISITAATKKYGKIISVLGYGLTITRL